jgi:hypothetical protein
MKLSGDMTVKLILGAAALVAGYYVVKKISGGISQLGQLVPQPIQDGVQATGQLLGLGGQIVTDPLDAFGVRPSSDAWVPTVPWEANEPPVDHSVMDARDAWALRGTGFKAPDAAYYKKYADPLVTDDGMDFRYF